MSLINNEIFTLPLEIDELALFFGDDYVINDKIKIKNPTLKEIREFGEKKYYSLIFNLTCIPSDLKSYLDDIGLNYMQVDDFELFMLLTKSLTLDKTCILFDDIDFTKFEIVKDIENEQLVMYNFENDIKIDFLIYHKIVSYLRLIHNIKPVVEKAANETTRKILISLDRQKNIENSKKPYHSRLKNILSALLRYEGCSLNLKELEQLNIYALTDLLEGAKIYISSTALLKGIYSGMLDTKKLDKEELNWLRNPSD